MTFPQELVEAVAREEQKIDAEVDDCCAGDTWDQCSQDWYMEKANRILSVITPEAA